MKSSGKLTRRSRTALGEPNLEPSPVVFGSRYAAVSLWNREDGVLCGGIVLIF